MKLKSTADGLKAVKETLEEILSNHTTGKGALIDNEIYVPFDEALLAMEETYQLNRNQPLDVKEQVREEAPITERKELKYYSDRVEDIIDLLYVNFYKPIEHEQWFRDKPQKLKDEAFYEYLNTALYNKSF